MIEKLDGVELRVLRLALGCALALVVAALIARGLVPAYKEYSQLSHTQGVMQQLVSNEEGVASDRSRIQREIDDLATLVQGDFASLPAQELGFVVVKEHQLMVRQSSDRKPQISAKLSLAAYRLDGVR